MGYNLDIAFVPQRSLDELSRRGRISRMRRARIGEVDPPRRLYNEDLIHHYLLAVSTDNPVVQFLSYYHILEHYFEAVFNDDLIDSIKERLTHPGFSYKRKKDIEQIINLIKKSLRVRNDGVGFSENEALRLCLERFVSIPELVTRLEEYDRTVLDYYRDNKVSFADGVAVDLRGGDSEGDIRKNLARRIYATRNALVHSKDGERGNYTPFIDERALAREIPVMRFMAEMVILRESELL
jgi:hypothetical protein